MSSLSGVADMDFAIAPSIRAALIERTSRPLGYHHFEDPPLINLLKEKLHKMDFPKIPDHGIHLLTGVVPGLYTAVFALTSPDDDVLTMTPIYPPFLSAISSQGRVPRHAPHKETPTRWQIDFDSLQSTITPTTKLLLLCHPHNPTGRVWTPTELKQLANFAERNNLHVVSDELHADLTLDGPFTPFTVIAPPDLQMRTITPHRPLQNLQYRRPRHRRHDLPQPRPHHPPKKIHPRHRRPPEHHEHHHVARRPPGQRPLAHHSFEHPQTKPRHPKNIPHRKTPPPRPMLPPHKPPTSPG